MTAIFRDPKECDEHCLMKEIGKFNKQVLVILCQYAQLKESLLLAVSRYGI